MKQEDTAFLEIHLLSSHLHFKVDSDGIQDNGLSIHLILHLVLHLSKFSQTISVSLNNSWEPVSNWKNANKDYENNSARICTRHSQLKSSLKQMQKGMQFTSNINLLGESACNWTNVNLTHAAIW